MPGRRVSPPPYLCNASAITRRQPSLHAWPDAAPRGEANWHRPPNQTAIGEIEPIALGGCTLANDAHMHVLGSQNWQAAPFGASRMHDARGRCLPTVSVCQSTSAARDSVIEFAPGYDVHRGERIGANDLRLSRGQPGARSVAQIHFKPDIGAQIARQFPHVAAHTQSAWVRSRAEAGSRRRGSIFADV
jgi:hypothetical protein